jgi:hypothetical protein
MGCCGSGNQPRGGSMQASPPSAPVRAPPMRYSHVFFEYIGPTALTAIGRASGKHYRFDRPGARMAVEPMDEASLRGVPSLRQVYSP